MQLFAMPRYKIKYFLEKECKGGLLFRLKKNLYSLRTDTPAEVEIANRIYRPSYISFEYALAYYNILPEAPYQLTSATTKPTREFLIKEKAYKYYSIKENFYRGYYLEKEKGVSFLIAEPEKALTDYLYFVSLGKKTLNDRLNLSGLDNKKINYWSNLYARKSLTNIIKNL